MPSVTPARLLVSVFLLMFLFLNNLPVYSLCQDYCEVIAILSMSVWDLLLLREFMTILSLPCRTKVVEEGGRDHRWMSGLALGELCKCCDVQGLSFPVLCGCEKWLFLPETPLVSTMASCELPSQEQGRSKSWHWKPGCAEINWGTLGW